MRAADFTYTTASGAAGSLSGVRAEYLLLLFYNPGCRDCARVEEHVVRSGGLRAADRFGQAESAGRLSR